jgi:hypothetical protein
MVLYITDPVHVKWCYAQIHILDSLSWSAVTVLELSGRIPTGVVSRLEMNG